MPSPITFGGLASGIDTNSIIDTVIIIIIGSKEFSNRFWIIIQCNT